MQRIEERYNELRNQLHNLQNIKKELAKSQPYEVQRLTSICQYFRLLLNACCLRGWAKAFLDQASLSSHCQRKHAKRESLLDDENFKLAACIWLHSTLPKD
ncbi:18339_t:CDS:2 [Gigaspora rosea]|nr:18339_t:CDS:2 [Gigaspora rosea]